MSSEFPYTLQRIGGSVGRNRRRKQSGTVGGEPLTHRAGESGYLVLRCLFLSSFDNVPACLPPHISEPHLFFMQQTVYERLSRASGPSPARQPHPRRAGSNALAFHFPFLPSAVRWQQRRASSSERPLLATFAPKPRAKRRAFSIEMLRVRNCAISAVYIGHG